MQSYLLLQCEILTMKILNRSMKAMKIGYKKTTYPGGINGCFSSKERSYFI